MARKQDTAERPRPRRRRRWLWRSLIVLVALIILLPALAFGLLQTGWGQRQGIGFANDVLAESGLSLQVAGIEGLVPFDMSVAAIRVDDVDGTAIAVDNLRLQIAAGDLFSGQVTVDTLAATRIAVQRAPITPPTPEAPPSELAWPALPVDLAVDRLDVDRVELGADLTGEDMALSIDGDLALGEAGGTATLTVLRLDDRPARIAMTADIDPTRNKLTLDLVAEEPEGGVVPRLAGWEYDGPWRLEVKGDGPFADWQGTLLATAGDRVLAELAFDGALDPDAPSLAIEGTVTPPAELLPPEIAPEPIALDLSAALGDDDARLAGSIIGRGLALTLDTSASLATPMAIDASIALRSDDLAFALAGLDLPVAGDIQLEAAATGPLDDLSGSVSIASDSIDAFGWQADDLALAATFAGAPTVPSGAGTLTLALSNPRGSDVDLQAYAVDSVNLATAFDLAADGRQLTVSDLSLSAGPHRVSGNAAMDLAGGPVGFDLAVSTDAAVALAIAGYAEAAGALAATVSGAFDPDAGLGWAELSVRGDDLRIGDPLLDAAVGPAPAIDAASQVDLAYGLQGLTAEIDLAQAHLEAEGDLSFDPEDEQAAPLGFSLSIASLAPLAEPLGFAPDQLAGALEISGSVGAPLSNAPRTTIDVNGTDVVAGGEQLGTVAATLAAMPVDGGAVMASLDASVDGAYGPVSSSIEASLDPAANRAALTRIDINALGTALTGALDIDLAATAIEGTLDVNIGNLATLQQFTGTPLNGAASARIALTHADGVQNAEVRVNGRQIALPDTVSVAALTANATIADLLGDMRLNGTVQTDTVATDAVTIEQATVRASGGLDALNLSMSAAGESTQFDEPMPLSIDADAVLSQAGDTLTIRLASLSGNVASETLALSQPATVRLAGPTLAVSGLDLALLGGRIAGDAQLSPGAVDVGLEATTIDLRRAAALAGVDGVAAEIDRLSINLSGTGARPSGTVDLQIGGVQLGTGDAAAEALANATLTASATLRQGMVDLRAELGNVTAEPVTFSLTNALQLSLSPFAASPDHGQPLDGRVLAQTGLQALSPFVAPSGDILLSGEADIDIAIGGVGGAPVLSGAGIISDATVEVTEIGLNLVNLNAEVAGDVDRLTIRRFSASDLRGGSISASGYADFGGEAASVNLDTTFNNLRGFHTDFAEADVSGTVSVAGPLTGPTVSGNVTVRPAEVRFAEIGTSSYVEVNAIDINGESQLKEEEFDPAPPIALPLDIAVTIPNALYIRGYGLDSEWGGNLDIAGTTSSPVITGQLNVIRGTMSLAGQEIEIGRGIVTFTGATPPDPLVDIEATTSNNDIAVTITVSGPASTAEFELESVPSLPQEEILSRLLFGVGSGGLSGNQAVQAGRALALLSGGDSDLGLVNTLRDVTGITGLTIEADTDSEGNPAGRVGGYVSEDVYLSVTRGSATGSGEAEISVEVFDGIDVQSTVTETGDSEVGINFEWDY